MSAPITVREYIEKMAASLKRDMQNKKLEQEFRDQAKEVRVMFFVELSRMSPARSKQIIGGVQ
jgi:hypothetical protein